MDSGGEGRFPGGSGGKGGDAAAQERRGLIISMATLLLSIPALIGA